MFSLSDSNAADFSHAHPEQVVAEIVEDDQPYAVFVDNNLG